MGRTGKRRDDVHVDAQAVGQQPADDGNRGTSSLDLEAPRSQPRHHRGGKTQRAQGETSRRRTSHRSDDLVQSPAGDDDDDDLQTDPTSVMPPPQRRLHRSATEPLEERRQYGTYEDDREDERLALVRRHSERLESPEPARRYRSQLPSDSEPETESGGHSDRSDESEVFRRQNARDLRDMIEEADDEATGHRRNRTGANVVSLRGGKARAMTREEDSIASHTDEEPNRHRELVVRGSRSSRQPEHEPEQSSSSRTQRHHRSSKTTESPRHSSKRTPSSRVVVEAPRSHKASTVASSRSSTTPIRRPTDVLSGFFKAPTPPKKHSKAVASSSAQKGATAHSERVECVICMCDVSVRKAAHLKCDHYMCNSCIKRAFTLSVEDSTHMPPKCCTTDHIPPKHVEKLFDMHFKKHWNRKFVEYTTKNRLYCPARRCGHFIKPSRIKEEKGRQYARCGHCDTKVCARCNNRWHKTAECPLDESMNEFLAQAKEEGWQRCYQCKAMVELREGCNHMKCRCGAEFCMICGTEWKTCDCPWFNDEAVAADRRAHLEGPPPPPRGDINGIFYGDGPPMPHELRGMPGFDAGPLPMRPRQHAYQGPPQEMYRGMQEHDDAEIARRMAMYGNLDDDYGASGYDMGAGNAAPRHMDYHYLRGGGQDMMHGSVPPLSAPYDRGSVTDYVSDVSRARGVREDSMERRLAERLTPGGTPTSMHLSGASSMAPPMPSAPAWPYSNLPPGYVVDGMTGTPMLAPSYYQSPTSHMDSRYGAMQQQSSPSHMSTPSYDCYDQRRVEVNTPRRRRRAQERERAATAAEATGRGRRSSTAISAADTEIKSSSLAGLTGPGRGMDRVAEWSYHVAPGVPRSTVGDGR